MGKEKSLPFPVRLAISQQTDTPCREAYCVKFSGRSPGFWLLTNSLRPSRPGILGPVALSRLADWRGFLPVTVARPRRICTGFPFQPRAFDAWPKAGATCER